MMPDADMQAIATVLAGHRCRVIGAAPIPYPILHTLLTVIAVNGGIASIPPNKRGHLGAPVDVWVVNARTAEDAKSHRLYPTMVQQGANRHVRLLVTLSKDEDDSCAQTLKRLKAQGTRWDAHVDINNSTRRRIEYLGGARLESEIRGNESTGGPMTRHALSAGLFAACLCFWAEAESVTLEGFSWEPGYSYPIPYPVTSRGHVAGDKLGLQRLQAQYQDRLFHTLGGVRPFQESDDMARVTDPHQRRLNRRARLNIVIPEYTGPLPRQVVATAPIVFYREVGSDRERRFKEGERIILRDPKHFKPSQMHDLWEPSQTGPVRQLPSAQEQSEALADQMSGRGRTRRQRRVARTAEDVQQQMQDHEQLAAGAGVRSVL